MEGPPSVWQAPRWSWIRTRGSLGVRPTPTPGSTSCTSTAADRSGARIRPTMGVRQFAVGRALSVLRWPFRRHRIGDGRVTRQRDCMTPFVRERKSRAARSRSPRLPLVVKAQVRCMLADAPCRSANHSSLVACRIPIAKRNAATGGLAGTRSVSTAGVLQSWHSRCAATASPSSGADWVAQTSERRANDPWLESDRADCGWSSLGGQRG